MTTDENNFVFPPRKPRSDRGDVVFTSCSRCFPIDTQAIRNKILDLAIRGKLTEQLPEDGSAEELYRQMQAKQTALIKEGKIRKEKQLPEIAPDEVQFEIPHSWKWVRMGCLLRVISGVSYEKADVSSRGMRILRGGNIQNMSIVLDSSDVFLPPAYREEDKIVKKGDVVIVASTGSETAIGRAGYVDKDYENTMIGAFLRICRPIDSEISLYVRTIFMGDYYRQHIRHEIRGMNINNVKEKYITHFIVPLPPLAEQHRIVERIDQAFSILDTIDALQAQYADNLTVLKSKLIDAAIQGKLTEQLPEDGTAEEFYRQIQAKKQALIKAGKIKKEKSLPEISSGEIPFEIPANWKWVRTGSIGITVTGGTPSKTSPAYYGGYYPFFKPSDLDAGRHITKASEYLTEEGKKVSRQLQQGSILVCCIGSIGKAAIIDTNGTANQQITALTPLESDSDYLLYAIASGAFQHQLEQGSRATTVSIINKSKFDNCILPLPPLAEQKRIVKRIDEVLKIVEV